MKIFGKRNFSWKGMSEFYLVIQSLNKQNSPIKSKEILRHEFENGELGHFPKENKQDRLKA